MIRNKFLLAVAFGIALHFALDNIYILIIMLLIEKEVYANG